MIGYLYYHTGEEYVSKFSLARDDARFGDTSRLFTALRTFVRGDGATFTYAVGGGDFLMLQTSSSRESGLTARGLRGACTEAARPPVREAAQTQRLLPPPTDGGLRMTRRDTVAMLALTAVYAAVALVNLGTLSAPETAWTPQAAGGCFSSRPRTWPAGTTWCAGWWARATAWG